MKRTTYILFGVCFANIIIAVISLVYLKGTLVDSDDLNYNFNFTQKYSTLSLDGIHTLEFSIKGVEAEQLYFRDPAKVEITSLFDQSKNEISYPLSDHLKLDQEDGILKVVLDLTSESFKSDESWSVGRGISLDGLNINVETDKSLKKVFSTKGFDVMFRQLELDSLHLISESVKVDSCTIASLALDGHMRFRSNASQIGNLYIDLDNINEWRIKEGKINTLHLTGSRKHQNNLSGNQYHKLVWEPKTEKAELKITLKGKSEIIADK